MPSLYYRPSTPQHKRPRAADIKEKYVRAVSYELPEMNSHMWKRNKNLGQAVHLLVHYEPVLLSRKAARV